MTYQDICKEAERVLTHFEKRGLTSPEAGAVMAIAIIALIDDRETADNYLTSLDGLFERAFKDQYRNHWGIKGQVQS